MEGRARQALEVLMADCNTRRPRLSIGLLAPETFAPPV